MNTNSDRPNALLINIKNAVIFNKVKVEYEQVLKNYYQKIYLQYTNEPSKKK